MEKSVIKPHKSISNNPFDGAPIEKVIHITQSQAEIWIACKLGGEDANRAYNESICLVLEGELDYSALDKAIKNVIQRHESLRAVFSPDGRFMSILEYNSSDLESIDLSHYSFEEKNNAIKEYILDDANHTFDLIDGPLFKVGLLKCSTVKYHLVITAHHIICDGWSLGVLLEELGAFYSSFVDGTPHSLPKVNHYSTYADELQRYIGSDIHKKTERFWLNQYNDTIPELAIPTDFPRPEIRTHKSDRLDFVMDKTLLSKLKQVGIKQGSSFVTTLMSAFEVFLFKQTGQDDITLGLPAAGQSVTGLIHLIGHCVNLLPLRSKLQKNQSFSSYLHQRKTSIFDAYDHQILSFGELLQKLQIKRDASRVPLLPVVFNIDMGMTSNVSFKNLTYSLISNPRTYETFEIFLNATGSESNLTLEWSYNTSLFAAASIKNMMATFEAILNKIVENPDINISDIIDIDTSSYNNLNNTKVIYPTKPLGELLHYQALKFANKPAVKFENTSISFEALDQQVNRLARSFTSKGLKFGDFVGVCLPRSIELVITLRALLQCGAAYVPLDSNYPVKRINYMLNDSEAKFLITTDAISKTLTSKANFLIQDDLFTDLHNFSSQPTDTKVRPSDMAYLLYTSGSTGKPKGVQVTHKNLVNFLYSMLKEPGVKNTDKLLSITTISFDIAGLELFAPLLSGATLVIANDEIAKDGRHLLEYIKKEGITILQATPTTWQMLVNIGWNNPMPIKALCGGEALTLNLANKILDRADQLWNMYGPTETTVWSSIKQIKKGDQIMSIGRPIANTQFYILNEQNNIVPSGVIGELCIAGDGVASGYWKRPSLTNEKFTNNPFEKGENTLLYHTGDLGKLLPNGELQCFGRIDQQVKIRGRRIELGEIEKAVNELHGVNTSIVIMNENYLIAHLTSNEIQHIDTNQTNSWKSILKEQLPSHMIPHQFNLLKKIPKTLNGKIDRKALLNYQPLSNGVLHITKPSTPSEEIILKIWKECLKLDEIDINSDYFEIGGHSLIGVTVMAKLEKETGNRLPLVSLLKHSTIKKLAAFMDSEFFKWDSLVALKKGGLKIPLYIVHGANHHVLKFNELAQNLDKDQPVYGLQSRGLNGITEPHDSIFEMAEDYISEILASNPNGPYALAGFSYGGIVAYEMARQLRAKGKEVTTLAQFDTYVFPEYYYSKPFHKAMISKLYLIGKMGYLFLNMFSNKKNFIRRSQLLKLQVEGLYLRFKYGKAKQYEMQFNIPSKLPANHHIATSNYTITPQDVIIDLFRAKEEVNFVHDHKFLGWKKMARKGIRKHIIPGNHVDMFEKGNVEYFAKELQHVLDHNNSNLHE